MRYQNMRKMTFSIRLFLLLVITVALLTSAYLHISRDSHALLMRKKAEIWEQKLSRDKRQSISFEMKGQRFGISNSEPIKISDERWLHGMSEVLKGELFAYPPGKRVKDIDEAFMVFEEYLRETRSQNKR